MAAEGAQDSDQAGDDALQQQVPRRDAEPSLRAGSGAEGIGGAPGLLLEPTPAEPVGGTAQRLETGVEQCGEVRSADLPRLQEARLGGDAVQRRRVARPPGRQQRPEPDRPAVRQGPGGAEVRDGEATVVHQAEVPGVRIAVQPAGPHRGGHEQPHQQRPCPVAVGLRPLGDDPGQRRPVDQSGDQHVVLHGHDVRHQDVGVPLSAASIADIACPALTAPPLSCPRVANSCSAVRCCTSRATASADRPPIRLPSPMAERPA